MKNKFEDDIAGFRGKRYSYIMKAIIKYLKKEKQVGA